MVAVAEMRRQQHGHKDATHDEVAAALERHGASVLNMTGQGMGAPDILAASGGRLFLVEVKGGRWKSERKPKPEQVAWAKAWHGPPPFLICNAEEAEALMTGGEAVDVFGNPAKLWGYGGEVVPKKARRAARKRGRDDG